MVKLITLLVSGIPALVSGLLLFIGRKWGVAAATLLLMVGLTVAMVAAINAILATLLGFLSVPGWVLTGLGMFIPANFALVLGAIVSARIARAAYDLAFEKAKAFNSAS